MTSVKYQRNIRRASHPDIPIQGGCAILADNLSQNPSNASDLCRSFCSQCMAHGEAGTRDDGTRDDGTGDDGTGDSPGGGKIVL
ncbi:Hypothetical protein NTJ_12802 [Nesidiocoris tenuis]|uniref:Uncharacterized protein n=1 Tax=Nesidiocoris tenuis TaxID=355587 RepID=A0ABN7B6G0_9HEMI|nr:Hypothetical protein NTJ_12802 [Nesidiocoris tenuis]